MSPVLYWIWLSAEKTQIFVTCALAALSDHTLGAVKDLTSSILTVGHGDDCPVTASLVIWRNRDCIVT